MVLMRLRTWTRPSLTILSGASAAANSAGVALLTPASVACADSTTATSSVNGATCRGSVCGFAFAALKRRNASSIAAAFQGGTLACAACESATRRATGPFTRARLDGLLVRGLFAVLFGAVLFGAMNDGI